MRIPSPVARLIDRVRPRVPARAWPILRTLASITADGPLVGLPSFRRVLVLAPHPDDETIGPGGTLAQLARDGAAVSVVVLTGGETTPGTGLSGQEIANRRIHEAMRACAELGLSQPRFLRYRDGSLPGSVTSVAADITELVGSIAPEALFLPWFGDGHPDHRALTDALARAAPETGLEIWAYETWTPLPATRLVDITPVIEAKRAALAAHTTAGVAFDLDAMTGLNRYRSVHGLAGHGWAEAFLVAPLQQYMEWVKACG